MSPGPSSTPRCRRARRRDDGRDLLLCGPGLDGRAFESAVLRDAVGGDRDVHHDVADADLVHEVAEPAELGHEIGLERAERRSADRSFAERAPQRDEVEGAGIHLIVREPAEQPPLRHLGAAQPCARGRALEGELGAAEQSPHARRGRRPASRCSRAARRPSRRRRFRRGRPAARARAGAGGRAGFRHPLPRAKRRRRVCTRAIALGPGLDGGAPIGTRALRAVT